MKLYSGQSELLAIRALCSPKRELSGYVLGSIDAEHFHTEEALEAYQRIIKVISLKGAPPSYDILCEDPRVSESTRAIISQVSRGPRTRKQVDQLLDNLHTYRKTRALYRLSKGILTKLEQPSVNIEGLVTAVQDRVSKLSVNKSLEDTIFHIGRDSNTLEIIKDIIYGEDDSHVIPTGFKTWDEPNGGFIRGSFVLIAGATGAGKSLIANTLAMNQARVGYKVAMVPLEMSLVEMLGRSISTVAGLDNTKVQFKRLADGEKELAFKRWRRFERQIKKAGGRYTIFKPNEDITAEETLGALHSHRPDVIYLDYMGLFAGMDSDDQWRKLGAVCRFGKIFAEMTKTVVVGLAQLSDEGIVRYSRAMAEHASTAWKFRATKESREQGYLQLEPFKARNQHMFDFTLAVDYAKQLVTDMAQEDRQAMMESTEQAANTRKKRTSSSDSADDADKYLPDLTSD